MSTEPRSSGGGYPGRWFAGARRGQWLHASVLWILLGLGIVASTVAVSRLKVGDAALKDRASELGSSGWKLRNRLVYEQGLERLLSQDTQEFRSNIVEPLRDETARLKRQAADLRRRIRLAGGLYDVMTTSMTLSVRSSVLVVHKASSPDVQFTVGREILRDFVLSEIKMSRLTVLYKEKNPIPQRPGWTYEGVTEMPPPNSPDRWMKGALGTLAIYISDGVIMHDTPVNQEQHDSIDHVCLQLSADAVATVFEEIYIGNQMVVAP